MNKKILIIIILVVVLGGGLTFFVIKQKNAETSSANTSANNKSPSVSTNINAYQSFTHPELQFTFQYPKDYSIATIEDDQGETILLKKSEIQNPKSETNSNIKAQNSKPEEFQIYISPFDEAGPITPERIKRDIPDMVIEDPQEVLIGEEKTIRALIFLSQHPSLGKTREIWFIWPPDSSLAGNYLYQITAYADMDNLIGPIMETWKFQ